MKKEELAYYGGEKSISKPVLYQWPIIENAEISEASKIISEANLSYNHESREIKKLEEKFINLIGTKYALALNSGTSALYLAFLSIGIQKGDKVAVPTYTFPATVMPLLHLGAKIVFIDTEKDSTRLSIEDLKNKLDDSFKCVVVAHLDGIPSNIKEIKDITDKLDCYLIEDCAQALGTKVDNQPVGSFGDVSIFSLQQKKLIASGEGGVFVTSNKHLYNKGILFSYLQKRAFEEIDDKELSRFAYTGLGFNFRIHPVSAAIANAQLDRFDSILKLRTTTIGKLAKKLESLNIVSVLNTKNEEVNSYYTLKMIYNFSNIIPINEFLILLEAEGLRAEQSLTKPLHLTEIFSEEKDAFFGCDIYKDTLENSENISKKLIRILPYYNLSEVDINQMFKAFEKIEEYLENNGGPLNNES